MYDDDVSLKKPRYRQSDGHHLIELRIKESAQLFDNRDPAPFREKDLDTNFVDYIFSALREFALKSRVKVIIHIAEVAPSLVPVGDLREAIRSHIAHQIHLRESARKDFWKRAQLFLIIGTLVLISCLGIAQNIPDSDNQRWLAILREGLTIFGWVSVWKPIEFVLFDWYPPFDDLRYLRKLLATDIEIRFGAVS